ncbi:hypothetical protein F5Y03DRAFT_52189 [Xylaria venustula]|nr:hypothetical protein F5Y03DRAFT_52189 [Xylaria venustula]
MRIPPSSLSLSSHHHWCLSFFVFLSFFGMFNHFYEPLFTYSPVLMFGMNSLAHLFHVCLVCGSWRV